MIVAIVALLGLGIWLSGVPLEEYLSLDSLIVITVAPLAMLLVGTPFGRVRTAFRTALAPHAADAATLAVAATVLRGLGRLVTITAAISVVTAAIAMLSSIRPDAPGSVRWLGAGSATALITPYYALILQAVCVQPLRIRLEWHIATTAGNLSLK